MTTPRECLAEAIRLGEHYQLAINDFVDDFRRARPDEKKRMIAEPLGTTGKLPALVAAVVSFVAHEADLEPPAWLAEVTSPEPFFILPARTFAMRVRLLLESPPPFRNRRVYVPENYLRRA